MLSLPLSNNISLKLGSLSNIRLLGLNDKDYEQLQQDLSCYNINSVLSKLLKNLRTSEAKAQTPPEAHL